jgi:hypothetical protein
MRLTRRALLRRSAVLATASLAVLAARPGRAQAVAAGPSSSRSSPSA